MPMNTKRIIIMKVVYSILAMIMSSVLILLIIKKFNASMTCFIDIACTETPVIKQKTVFEAFNNNALSFVERKDTTTQAQTYSIDSLDLTTEIKKKK